MELIPSAVRGAGVDAAAAMIVTSDDSGVAQYLCLPESRRRSSANVVRAFESAYGAEAVVEEPDASIMAAGATAAATFNRPLISVDSARFSSESTVATTLAEMMPSDSWVAISFRSPNPRESQRFSEWMLHRLGSSTSHNSMDNNAMLISVTAGASSQGEARMLVDHAVSAMRGLDMDIKARALPLAHRRTRWAVLGAVLSAVLYVFADLIGQGLGWLVSQAPDYDGESVRVAVIEALSSSWLFPAATVFFLVLMVLGFVFSPCANLRRHLKRGRVPAPSKDAGRVVAPREAGVNEFYDENAQRMKSKRIRARSGSYPLNPRVFKVAPTVFASAANPHGVARASTRASRRLPSSELAAAQGVSLGDSVIPDEALDGSVVVFGKKGGGKSVLIQGLWGYCCDLDIEAGASSAMVAFESKGEGAGGYLDQSRARGAQTLRIDAMDTSAPMIDVFDAGGSVQNRADHVVSVLAYAFTDDAVGPASTEALRAIYPAAFVWVDHVVPSVVFTGSDSSKRMVDVGRSVHQVAHALALGAGEETFYDVIESLESFVSEVGPDSAAGTEAQDALDGLRPIREMSKRDQAGYLRAPRNKIDDINSMGFWFNAQRPTITFSQIIAGGRRVVINTGSSVHGQMDERNNQRLTAMLLFALQRAVFATADGFGAQGRRVRFFADELAMLIGTNGEVFSRLQNQGRSYGVQLFLASQFPAQLDSTVVATLDGFDTVGTFTQQSQMTAEFIASHMLPGLSAEEVRQLGKYVLAYRTTVNSHQQPPTTVAVRNFTDDGVGAEDAAPAGRQAHAEG